MPPWQPKRLRYGGLPRDHPEAQIPHARLADAESGDLGEVKASRYAGVSGIDASGRRWIIRRACSNAARSVTSASPLTYSPVNAARFAFAGIGRRRPLLRRQYRRQKQREGEHGKLHAIHDNAPTPPPTLHPCGTSEAHAPRRRRKMRPDRPAPAEFPNRSPCAPPRACPAPAPWNSLPRT